MDPVIDAYIQETFHPEKCQVIVQAFQVLEDFAFPDFQSPYVELVMTMDQYNAQDVQDHFTTKLHEQLDFVVHSHMIRLNEATPIWEKVNICEALFKIQNLDDYTNIAVVLESELDPEEKMADVLSQCCALTVHGLLPYVFEVSDSVISQLKTYIHEKEETEGKTLTSFTELQKKIIQNLRLFKAFLESEKRHAVGIFLLEHNVLIGQPLERYIPFVDECLRANDYEQVALDAYSLILLTDEGYNNPIHHFKKNTGLLLDDLHSITKVDVLINQIAAGFERFKNDLKTEKAS